MQTNKEVIEYLEKEIKIIEKFILWASQAEHRQILDELSKCKLFLHRFKAILCSREIRRNYLDQLITFANNTARYPYRDTKESAAKGWNTEQIKNILRQFEGRVAFNENVWERALLSIEFFEKIGFLESNITFIGANGSGKTSLANKLAIFLNHGGALISAQKALFLPVFDSMKNSAFTKTQVEQDRRRTRRYRDTQESNTMMTEFGKIISHLLAEYVEESAKYFSAAKKVGQLSGQIPPPIDTLLDKSIMIWNSLINHRSLVCDGMNLEVVGPGGKYPASNLSDGEKVILFAIGHVLLAPENGFIIIDEPEMYLHKTILKKLWDILEAEREDCIFVYLTHDLDFASSRVTSAKKWLKQYNESEADMESWEIVDIPDNDIPEPLMMELLGSRKHILFCEGDDKKSYDFQVYSVLFPEFSIIPVSSCLNVIYYTKAFNRLPDVAVRAYGLIDSDFHDEARLNALKADKVYSFKLAEVENLFFDESFMAGFGDVFLASDGFIEGFKQKVICQFQSIIDVQVANFVTAFVDFHFKDVNMSVANNLAGLEKNFNDFVKSVDIKQLFESRAKKLDEMIAANDYSEIIKVFNHKGLKKTAATALGIENYIEKAIKYLKKYPGSHEYLLKYFPPELVIGGRAAKIEVKNVSEIGK